MSCLEVLRFALTIYSKQALNVELLSCLFSRLGIVNLVQTKHLETSLIADTRRLLSISHLAATITFQTRLKRDLLPTSLHCLEFDHSSLEDRKERNCHLG